MRSIWRLERNVVSVPFSFKTEPIFRAVVLRGVVERWRVKGCGVMVKFGIVVKGVERRDGRKGL